MNCNPYLDVASKFLVFPLSTLCYQDANKVCNSQVKHLEQRSGFSWIEDSGGKLTSHFYEFQRNLNHVPIQQTFYKYHYNNYFAFTHLCQKKEITGHNIKFC